MADLEIMAFEVGFLDGRHGRPERKYTAVRSEVSQDLGAAYTAGYTKGSQDRLEDTLYLTSAGKGGDVS